MKGAVISNEKNISGRLLALLAAVIFGFGVFLIIRLGDYATEIQPVSESEIQNKVSDSDKAESSSSEPESSSSEPESSSSDTVTKVNPFCWAVSRSTGRYVSIL